MRLRYCISIFVIGISLVLLPTGVFAGTKKIGERCIDKAECLSNNCEESDLPKFPGELNPPSYCTCDVTSLGIDSDDCAQAYGGDDWGCSNNVGDSQITHFGINFCEKNGYFTKAVPEEDIKKFKPIGANCTSDSECMTNNCEKSDLPDSPSFCVCDEPYHCVYTYKTKVKEEKWSCESGEKISHDVHYCKSDLNGAMMPIPSDALNAATTKAEEEKKPQPFNTMPPKITIPIPNLPTFTSTQITPGETVRFTWIGDYMLAVINYMLAIGALLGVLTLAGGGVLYILGGASPSLIAKAKGMMWGSLSGTIILLSSYLVLNIVNPRLTEYPNLAYETVKRAELFDVISSETYQAVTGTPLPKITDAGKAAIIKLAGDQAEAAGLPRCLAETLIKYESGGRPNVIGHDENFPRATLRVGARIRFLLSGKKFSGATFASPNPGLTYQQANAKLDSLKGDARTAYLKQLQVANISNDDGWMKVNPASLKPPDYGIDWNYSHGFGLGQITCGGLNKAGVPSPGCRKNGNAGCSAGGKCYTVPEMLTIEGGIAAKIGRLTSWYKTPCWGVPGGKVGTPQQNVDLKIIEKTMANWGRGCTQGSFPTATPGGTRERRMKTYRDCIAGGGTLVPAAAEMDSTERPTAIDPATSATPEGEPQ